MPMLVNGCYCILGTLNSLLYHLISCFPDVPSVVVPFNQQRYYDIVNCYLLIVEARTVNDAPAKHGDVPQGTNFPITLLMSYTTNEAFGQVPV